MTRWTPEETGTWWVVGGRYADVSFTKITWCAPALGPFSRRADAEGAWRRLSFAYAADGLVRFSIVEPSASQAAA